MAFYICYITKRYTLNVRNGCLWLNLYFWICMKKPDPVTNQAFGLKNSKN